MQQDSIFKNITTTSVIAVLTVVLGFITLLYLLCRFGDDATTRTQIITGLLALMAFPMQYLYGQSKQRPVAQNTDTSSTADETVK